MTILLQPMTTIKTKADSFNYKNIARFALFSLTLGLAPFYPEPHVIGKIRWVMGGAVGMQPMDWFDLVLHGTPWVLLIGSVLVELYRQLEPRLKSQ